jgi:hypothetical protein
MSTVAESLSAIPRARDPVLRARMIGLLRDDSRAR